MVPVAVTALRAEPQLHARHHEHCTRQTLLCSQPWTRSGLLLPPHSGRWAQVESDPEAHVGSTERCCLRWRLQRASREMGSNSKCPLEPISLFYSHLHLHLQPFHAKKGPQFIIPGAGGKKPRQGTSYVGSLLSNTCQAHEERIEFFAKFALTMTTTIACCVQIHLIINIL